MIEKREKDYEDYGLSIDDGISQFWCRVIEEIVQDTVQKTLRSIQIERFTEVEIVKTYPETNRVDCRNIQTGEVFKSVPNYSNQQFAFTVDENGNKNYSTPSGKRGRVFITNIKDNPYYLGVWYNNKEAD